jgi:hypothetical protein
MIPGALVFATVIAAARLHCEDMIRRFASLILCGLMLQLTLRASDLMCARHDAQAPSAGFDHRSAMSMAEGHDRQTAGEQKTCEIPVARDCCHGVVSCAMTLGLGERLSATNHLLDHDVALQLRTDAPTSPVSSPEPPPPKL